jgi:hypothetical protein
MLGLLLSLGLALATASPDAAAPPSRTVGNESFSFPLPDGYRDVTNDPRLKTYPHKQISVEAIAATKGFNPSITVLLAPIWGGTLGDAKVCRETAANLAGPRGKLTAAEMIPGPRGTICQFRFVEQGLVVLVTELISFTETWVMTCNHAEGDAQAEKVCRATLAGFKFKDQEAPPKIDLPRLGVPACDEYLSKFRACILSRFPKTQVSIIGVLLKIDAERLRQLVASEQGRKDLPQQCAGLLAQAKKATKDVNCAW